MPAHPHAIDAELSDRAAVLSAEQARVRAVLAGDLPALDALLSDDLVYTHLSGRVEGKRAYVAGLTERVAHHDLQLQDLDVRLYEDLRFGPCGEALETQVVGAMAVLTGTYRFEASVPPSAGARRYDGRVTQVWRLTPRGWKLTASHGCPLPH